MNLDSPTHNSDNDQDEARSDKETDGENDMNEGEVNQSTKKVTLEDEVEKELWSPPHVWINTSEIPNGDVSFLVGLNSPSCNEQEGVPKHYTGENLTLQTITAAMEKAGEHISKEIELRGALVEIFHKREKADSEEKDDENISASDKEDEKEEVDEGHDSGSEHSTSKAKRKEQKVINLTLLRVSAGGCYTNITLISAHPRVHIFVYPGHYREPNGQLVIDTQVLKPRKDHKESDNTMNISGSILIRGLSELDVHNKALKLSQIKSRQKKTGSKRSPTMNNTYVFRQDALNEHSASDNALYALCKRRAIVPLINGDVASQRILEERHRRLFFPTIEGIVEILGPTSCYYDHGDRHATPTMSLSGRKHGQGNVQQFEEDTPRDDQNHAAEEISHPAENLVSHENLSEKEINNKEMLYSINQVQRNYQSSPITIEHLNLVGGVRFRAQSVAEITQCSIMCLDQISSQYGLWPGASDEMDELDPSKNTNNVSMDSLKQSSPPGTNLPEVCVAIHAHAKPLLRNCCITTRHDARLAAWYDPWLFGDREIENKPFYNCDSLDKEKLLRRIQHANDRFYFHHHSGVAKCENHPNQVRIGLYVYPLARGLVQGCLVRCWNAAPVIFHEKLHGLNEDAPPPPPFLRALFNSAQGGSTDLKTPDNILDIGAVLHGESTTLFRHSIFSGGDVNLYVLSNEDHLLHNHIESKLIEMYRTFRSKMNENDNPDDEDVDKEDGTSSPQRKRDSKYIALLRRDTVKQLGCSFQRCDFLSARVMTVRIVGRRRSQTPLSCTNCVFAPLNIPWCAQVWAKSFLAILPPGLSVRNQKNNSAKEVTLNLVTSKSALLRTHMMNMPSPLLLNDDKNEEQRRRMPYAIHCTAGGSMTLRGCVIHRGVVYFDTTCLVRESRFSNDDNPFYSTYGNVTCLENILTATSHVSSTCEKTSSLKNGFSERDDVLSLPRAKEIPRSVPVEIGYPLPPSFLLAKRFREEGGFESDKKRDGDSAEKEDTDDIPRTISSLEILQRGYMLLGDTLVSQNTTVQNGLSDIRPTDNEPYTDSFVWGVLAPSISKQVAKESNVESEE